MFICILKKTMVNPIRTQGGWWNPTPAPSVLTEPKSVILRGLKNAKKNPLAKMRQQQTEKMKNWLNFKANYLLILFPDGGIQALLRLRHNNVSTCCTTLCSVASPLAFTPSTRGIFMFHFQ